MNFVRETLRAYERWAPVYPPVAHNPLMRAEQKEMLAAWPDMHGMRVLDLACGSGRYTRLLSESGAAEVVSLDFCMQMLQQVPARLRVCASMMDLPFQSDSFDAVISGLALGHAPALAGWVSEVARVLRKGGAVLYSDFHPQAARAGLTRSFKDADQVTCTVPHEVYEVESQLAALMAAGMTVDIVKEIRVGRELCEAFPGSESFYRDWHDLPIVLIVRARR